MKIDLFLGVKVENLKFYEILGKVNIFQKFFVTKQENYLTNS